MGNCSASHSQHHQPEINLGDEDHKKLVFNHYKRPTCDIQSELFNSFLCFLFMDHIWTNYYVIQKYQFLHFNAEANIPDEFSPLIYKKKRDYVKYICTLGRQMRASYSYLFSFHIHFLTAKLLSSYITSNTAAESEFLKLLVGRDSMNECLVLSFVFTWGHLASVGRFFSWKRLTSCFFWSKAIILLTASLSLSSCSNVWKYKRGNFYFHSNLCGLILRWHINHLWLSALTLYIMPTENLYLTVISTFLSPSREAMLLLSGKIQVWPIYTLMILLQAWRPLFTQVAPRAGWYDNIHVMRQDKNVY